MTFLNFSQFSKSVLCWPYFLITNKHKKIWKLIFQKQLFKNKRNRNCGCYCRWNSWTKLASSSKHIETPQPISPMFLLHRLLQPCISPHSPCKFDVDLNWYRSTRTPTCLLVSCAFSKKLWLMPFFCCAFTKDMAASSIAPTKMNR